MCPLGFVTSFCPVTPLGNHLPDHQHRQYLPSVAPSNDLVLSQRLPPIMSHITSVGNMCLDIILPITNYPILQGHHQSLISEPRLELGGSFNALISAARLGAPSAPIFYLPDPESSPNPTQSLYSQFYIDSARRLNLACSAMVHHPQAHIPTCAALFNPNGSHTFLATNELPKHVAPILDPSLPSQMRQAISLAKVLIVDGYSLCSDRKLVEQAAKSAIESGTQIWVDPQAAVSSLLSTDDQLLKFLLRHAHGVSLTTEEAFVLTETQLPAEVAHRLSQMHCPEASTVLLKDGPRGSHVIHRVAHGDFEVHSIPAVALDSGKFKDSIGAGDAFLGAFLAASLLHGFTLWESGMVASCMGTATCMHHGAGEFGIGTLDEVLNLLGSRGELAAKLRQAIHVVTSEAL
eukprot:GFKZ01011142.1.p1 GENE.GFKZ01011142.1~~GFKZ01011142.1.p1  ORF type:complete len:405 (-),score=24.25 GFKZ01011142.1:312-1526(-)